MYRLNLSFDHQLNHEEARQRVETLLEQARQSGGRWTQRWTRPDRLQFRAKLVGGTVSGEVTIHQERIAVTISLPWSLQFLAGRIQQSIEQSAREVLNGR
jgi:hypothetical protein